MASPLPSLALGLVLLVAPLTAAAQETDAPPASPEKSPWERHAIHAGAGAGMLADVHEPTVNARVLAVLALTEWAALEGGFTGMRFSAEDHHGERSSSTGLGIAFGFRFAPLHSEIFRPYAAARVTHIHMSPDIWGKHEDARETGVAGHESTHRFGAALGLGVEAAPTDHLRFGFDAEALALSGPGTNVGLQGVLTVGFAF